MSAQLPRKTTPTTFTLDALYADALSGVVRVPTFQRNFKWGYGDVSKLFESIVLGYPVGNILLWKRNAPAEQVKLGALDFAAPSREEALWVVDGQQRITSIACALSDKGAEDPRFALAYDLVEKEFVKPSRSQPTKIPLPVLFDLRRVLRWFSEHPDINEHLDHASNITTLIRQYAIPAYIVLEQDEQVLREIFDRMNNYGKRLTRSEVFSALHPSSDDQNSPRGFSAIAKRIADATGFGTLDDDTVMYAMLARRGPDVMRDIRHEFKSTPEEETRDEAYQEGEAGLLGAIRFLQEDAFVLHMGFLAYKHLLIVLSRFFALHPTPSMRNRELLRRWYWRAAVIGPVPMKGGTQSSRTFNAQIGESEDDSVQQLLRTLEGLSLTRPDISNFKANSAASKMLLSAMWALSPRSLLTGEPYEKEELFAELIDEKSAKSIAYAATPEFKERAGSRLLLLEYGEDDLQWNIASNHFPPHALASHCLNESLIALYQKFEFEDFVTQREVLLRQALDRFLTQMTASEFEDTPPLASLNFDQEDEEALDETSY
jgi:hypothetical protein